MPLHGIATAIAGTAERSSVSLTTLVSEDADHIEIDKSQKIDIVPAHTREAREALMVVLSEICRFRAQMIDVGDGQQALIPLSIVYGVPEKHPEEQYATMLTRAFPEYFGSMQTQTAKLSVNDLLQHLFLQHFARHGLRPAAGEQSPLIELHPYLLFAPDDPDQMHGFQVTPQDKVLEPALRDLHTAAEAGDGQARTALEIIARRDADIYAQDCARRGILPSTRFVLFGPRRKEFQESPRYTYLEWYNLREIFAEQFMKHLPAPHNVCVKTPNMEPSPSFADITATYLADLWDLLHQARTGVMPKKRHVYAKYRP